LDGEITDMYKERYLKTSRFEFDTQGAPFSGQPLSPKVVMVEFFDYGCPACRSFHRVLEDVILNHPQGVVLYYKHFPLVSHPDSMPAAMAAACAHKQDRFHAMHAKLFANQDKHTQTDLYAYAREIGLSPKEFDRCFQNPQTREQVMDDRKQAEQAHMNGTPALYINGRSFSDRYDKKDVVDWVSEELRLP